MALFRRSPQVVKRSSREGTVEEHKTVRVKGRKVELKRVESRTDRSADGKNKRGKRSRQSPNRITTSRKRDRRFSNEEIILPPESGRKQMLIRVSRISDSNGRSRRPGPC